MLVPDVDNLPKKVICVKDVKNSKGEVLVKKGSTFICEYDDGGGYWKRNGATTPTIFVTLIGIPELKFAHHWQSNWTEFEDLDENRKQK